MRYLTYGVLHLFSGIGGAALGFSDAQAEWRGLNGSFINLAGIDCDPDANADFEALTGTPALQLDLFTREDYRLYHGQEPPEGWRETIPGDIQMATGNIAPDVVFLSPPCKGFSGLLPNVKARSAKYQALNRLVPRGLQLVMEAYADDLPAVIMLENVPRITSRGAGLLREVKQLLRHHGYVIHPADDRDGYHDCGELGGLAQRRRRYLLIARHPGKVLPFIYRPPLQRVKAIGEVLEQLPLPDDPGSGLMHRLPRLQWRTWVRLALIPAGGDWRDLEKIAPEEYRLEYVPRGGGAFGVQDWNQPGNTVIGNAKVRGSNGAAVADPRLPERGSRHPSVYRVVRFDEPAPCVTGTRFGSGAPAVADPRTGGGFTNKHKVHEWDKPAGTVTGTPDVQAGAPSVADPRKPQFNHVYRVTAWENPAGAVTGAVKPSSGALSVADPRFKQPSRSGTMGVQDWDDPAATVTAALDVHSGPGAVADPRIPGETDRPDPPPVIIALDGTRHRPLTTLELAALQGFPVTMSDGRPLQLAGKSDARWRERIGNAVPPAAAQAAAESILEALLRSSVGFWMCDDAGALVWVRRPVNHGASGALLPAGSGVCGWPG